PEQLTQPTESPPASRTFIPPAAERPAHRPPRMPRIDELPLPAQAQLRAQRGEPAESEHPEKRKLGLLRRLAAVGLGRREDEEPEKLPANVRPARPVSRPAERDATSPPRPATPPPRGPEPVSEYAKRPPHQGLDPHGRQ